MRVSWQSDLLSDHFDGKQSRESVDLPLACHSSPRLTSKTYKLPSDIRISDSLNVFIDNWWNYTTSHGTEFITNIFFLFSEICCISV